MRGASTTRAAAQPAERRRARADVPAVFACSEGTRVHVVELAYGATAYLQPSSVSKPKPARRVFPAGTKVTTPYGAGVVEAATAGGEVYTVALLPASLAPRPKGKAPAAVTVDEPRARAVVPGGDVMVRHVVSAAEHLTDAVAGKATGNGLFKKKQYPAALRAYQQVTITLNRYTDLTQLTSEQRDVAVQTLFSTYLNMAQCFRNTKMPVEAVKFSSGAIELDPKNKTGQLPKAYLRRAQALHEDKEYEKALSDLKVAHSLVKGAKGAKGIKALRESIVALHAKVKEAALKARSQQAKQWGGFLKGKEGLGGDEGGEGGDGGAAGAGGSPLPQGSPARSIDSATPRDGPSAGGGGVKPAGSDLVEELGEVGMGDTPTPTHAAGDSEGTGALVAGLALLGAAVMVGILWWRRR